MKKNVGFILFLCSITILLNENRVFITGGSVSEIFNFSYFNLFGILLFLISLVLIFSSKKSLDYLVIPGGNTKWRKERVARAKDVRKERKVGRTYVMRGADSEEDILLLGEKLKGGERIGIDTFPLHYQEYLTIISKAQRDRKFPKDVEIENIKISQDWKDWIYGVLGWGEEVVKRRKVAYVKDRQEKYLPKIKSFIKKYLIS